jgi:flagellar basal body L-ring protein FlgH
MRIISALFKHSEKQKTNNDNDKDYTYEKLDDSELAKLYKDLRTLHVNDTLKNKSSSKKSEKTLYKKHSKNGTARSSSDNCR